MKLSRGGHGHRLHYVHIVVLSATTKAPRATYWTPVIHDASQPWPAARRSSRLISAPNFKEINCLLRKRLPVHTRTFSNVMHTSLFVD